VWEKCRPFGAQPGGHMATIVLERITKRNVKTETGRQKQSTKQLNKEYISTAGKRLKNEIIT
jgi:hypothetical protein